MIRSIVTRFTVGIGLFFASWAWSAWAYLHTVADPHRAEAVANAVLEDPAARLELAEPLADQLVEQADLDPATVSPVSDAMVAVMADPRIAANLTAAIGSAHARSFGVDDPRPATIDGALLVAAVRDHLSSASPELAARIPADLVGDLRVPEPKLPFIAGLRTVATTTIEWMGAAAVGLLTFSLLAGDRVYTLRRFGFWAIASGLAWAVGPRLVTWLARQFLPSIDATLAAGVGAATSAVTVAATVMVGSGVGVLGIAQFLSAMPSRGPASMVDRRPRRATKRGVGTASSPSTIASPSTSVRTVAPPSPTPTPGGPLDHAGRTSPLPETPSPPSSAGSAGAPTVVIPTVTPGTSDLADLVRSLSREPSGPEADADPWTLFAGPAVEPGTGRPLPPRPPSEPPSTESPSPGSDRPPEG